MLKNYRFSLLIAILFVFNSCAKDEVVNVLQDQYDPSVKPAESTGEDFIVTLNARALQPGERGEWKIVSGNIVDPYVYFEDKTNPFTKFKGLPGEEYMLEWKRLSADGNTTAVQSAVKIPQLAIEIIDSTPIGFETIRTLSVNPKYRGTWTIEGSYAQLTSMYHDGYAEPPEKKPTIELHGYANTSYTATYKYSYADIVYEFKKIITTGNYTQGEGLYLLQLSGGSSRVITDNSGNVLELNLQASGIAWIFGEPKSYPALSAFRKLRKLILGGSSLAGISTIFGDSYLDLEELSMDAVGYSTVFPENFGNMTKLKVLLFSPRNSMPYDNEVLLPKSFGNLKALESLSIKYSGYVNFNGTLGKLSSLKKLETTVNSLTEDIGDLKELEHLEVNCRNSYFPQRFGECKSLIFARVIFNESATGDLVLSSKMGDLKKLETFEITTSMMRSLPDSFSSMTALKKLVISGNGLQSIPENIGFLQNLESLTLYGSYTKIPNTFGNLNKLTSLSLGGNIETLPESFGNLSSLSYFDGQYTTLKALPASFGKLKKLKELSLQKTKIDNLPASFADLDALETLNLASTLLKTFPKSIIPLKNIRTVNMNNCTVGDIPDDISKMKSVVVFNLYNVPNLTLEHLKNILTIAKGKVYYTDFGYYSSAS